MHVKTYSYTLSELDIDPERVLALMGFEAGMALEPFPEMVQEALRTLQPMQGIKGGYRIVSGVAIKDAEVCLGQTVFHTGRRVAQFLKNCTTMAVFACTAGPVPGLTMQKYNRQGKSIEAYVVDVLGSVIAETAMDRIHQQWREDANAKGTTATNRYSPGYCNWSVADQFNLFELLPPGFCGITLNGSALMHPVKSVSGIMGMGEKARFQNYTCDACNSKNCMYRGRH